MSADYRKGQRVYLARMGTDGLYEVVPGSVARIDHDGTVFVRIRVEPEPGRADSVVVDVKGTELFTSRPEAVLATAERCHKVALRWEERAFALMRQLSRSGPGDPPGHVKGVPP